MADLVIVKVDIEGRVHSRCLHWEGFPTIPWDTLSAAGYVESPFYVGREFEELGVPRCQVQITVPPHPLHPEWPILNLEVIGHRLADTWESAALKTLTTFCSQHPVEIVMDPIGLFPLEQADDPMWVDHIQHAEVLGFIWPKEVIHTTTRCMTALFRLLTQQSAAIASLSDLAQANQMMGDNRDAQIAELTARVGELEVEVEEVCDDLNERIGLVDMLEDQVHDLQIELADANKEIQQLQLGLSQEAPPDLIDLDAAEPEIVEGVFEINFKSAAPQMAGYESLGDSQSSVGNLDDF